jgi:MFS family permease
MSQTPSVNPTNNQSGTLPKEVPSRFRMTLRALRYRNYRLFFAGQIVSLIGTWMQMVAQSWLVYRLTGSSFLLGSVGFASQIPVFLLAFIGGTVADRYNRHRLVIATQTSAMFLALILSILTLTDAVRVWHIFLLSIMLGVVNAFDMPARQAFVVQLVEKKDLINAIALNSSAFNSARVLGPAVAGLLIAGIGEGWCFFANGISYVAVLVGLLLMKLPPVGYVPRHISALSNVLEGFRYVRRTKAVRSLLILIALVSIMGMPYSVLMPIFADEILHGGPRGLGILMGATGLGALAGSLFLAARSGIQGLGRVIAYSCTGFGLSLFLFAISRSFWLSVAFLLPAGFALMVLMASTNTLIQTIVPDHLRGRVMALHVTMFIGMFPFGSFLAGVIAERLGAPATIAAGASACVVGSLVLGMRLRKLRLPAAGPIHAHMDE